VPYATHAGIRTRLYSTSLHKLTSPPQTTLPYHARSLQAGIRSFGSRLEPRYIVGAKSLDQ
jgi:hypothetical protein